MDYYNIIVSPETISSDLVTVDYSGQSVGVYSAMTQVLSGGTNGSSLLTGLTIPILITETVNDFGYYDPFDGAIYQQDVVTNFIFSSTTSQPYVVNVYNTSSDYNKFLELSTYYVDWGDGTAIQPITNTVPNFISHSYPVANQTYTITLEQTNPWGITKVSKTVTLPYSIPTINNKKGTAYFVPAGGEWFGIPISYDYIFSGDAVNSVSAQTSSTYVSTPYIISGASVSRLQDLEQYGSQKYIQGVPVIKNREIFGIITNIDTVQGFTAYTIQNIDYYDYSDGTTLFFATSSGFTKDNITAEPISKREVLINVIDQPQIQTNVYIERGKNSAYEKVQRLGEVDNVGDLVNYGYGFFTVEKKV